MGGSLTDNHRCDGSMVHDNKSAVAGAKTDLAGVKPFVRGFVDGWNRNLRIRDAAIGRSARLCPMIVRWVTTRGAERTG